MRSLIAAAATLLATAPVSAQVRWQIRQFDEACRAGARFVLPVSSAAFGELGQFTWIGPNRIAMTQFRAQRVQVFDTAFTPVFAFGRKGHGPGELQLPGVVARLSDTVLAVPDPMQMRVHLFTHSGKFIRSFMTSRFPPKRLLRMSDGRLAAAGLSNVDTVLVFLSLYSMEGARMGTALNAPAPYRDLVPRIDDVILTTRADGSIVLVPSGLDTVFMLRRGVESRFGLSLPSGYWNQMHSLNPELPWVKLRPQFEKFSYITNGGLLDDSTLLLGWRTGREDEVAFALVDIDRRAGVLLTDAPGTMYGMQERTIYVKTEETDDSSIIQKYSC